MSQGVWWNKSVRLICSLFLAWGTWSTPVSAELEDSGPQRSPPPSTDAKKLSPSVPSVVGEEATGFAQRSIGIRGAVVGNGNESLIGGGMLYEKGTALLFGKIVSARYLDELWIGGDGGGVTYSLAGQMGIGARWDMLGNHGPFVRLEMRGEMRRIGGWYYSSLRLPGAQVGWGVDNGPWLVELFGHLSPSLTGRWRNSDFSRKVKGVFSGGAGTIAWKNWHLTGDLSYLLPTEERTSLWDVRGSVCSYWGQGLVRVTALERQLRPRKRKYSFSICADGTLLNQHHIEGSLGLRQFSTGLSIVIGQFSRLDRATEL